MAYQSRLTTIGATKQSAFLTGGAPINIVSLAVGDQSGTEQELGPSQEDLINEVRRAGISRFYTDPTNPLRKIFEQVIPLTSGGYWVREASLIDADGDVVAIANVPPIFKPIPASGSTRILTVRIGILLSNASAVAAPVIDADLYATVGYADQAIADAIDALPLSWGDADNLGGNPPSHYATSAGLTAVSDSVDTLGTAVTNLQDQTNAIPIIPTGTEFGYWGNSAPAGYVLASGRTIGSAASGATERANADTQALFTLLWTAGSDTTLPIQTSTGSASTRGASAAADFAANKRISVPDLRGRTGVGKDNMGGSTASRVTAAGSGTDGTVFGATGGAETHTLTTAQMPSHSHTISALSGRNTSAGGGEVIANTSSNTTMSTNSQGSGQAHNNMQPFAVRNVIIKL